MAITYTAKSIPLTGDGWYLVRLQDGLQIAEYMAAVDCWCQVGFDYDIWEYAHPPVWLEVVCKLDLEQLAVFTDTNSKAKVTEEAIRKAGKVVIDHMADNGLTYEAVAQELTDCLMRIVDPDFIAALAAQEKPVLAPATPLPTLMVGQDVNTYTIGPLTMARVFKPTGITNVADVNMQALWDQIERALATALAEIDLTEGRR